MTYQIIYSSEATTPMQSEDLEEILDHARSSNAIKGITGALVYGEGMFLQILEGDRVAVMDLMAKICRDVRHEAVTVLREGEIPAALFRGWKMAYVSATAQQVAKWAGLDGVTGSAERANDISDEAHRTARFAQDILSLLVRDRTTQTKV